MRVVYRACVPRPSRAELPDRVVEWDDPSSKLALLETPAGPRPIPAFAERLGAWWRTPDPTRREHPRGLGDDAFCVGHEDQRMVHGSRCRLIHPRRRRVAHAPWTKRSSSRGLERASRTGGELAFGDVEQRRRRASSANEDGIQQTPPPARESTRFPSRSTPRRRPRVSSSRNRRLPRASRGRLPEVACRGCRPPPRRSHISRCARRRRRYRRVASRTRFAALVEIPSRRRARAHRRSYWAAQIHSHALEHQRSRRESCRRADHSFTSPYLSSVLVSAPAARERVWGDVVYEATTPPWSRLCIARARGTGSEWNPQVVGPAQCAPSVGGYGV